MFESRLTKVMAFGVLLAAFAVALIADDPTPALTLAGALAVAIIAAETADTRQRRQIEAERERHLATLVHDRELADLADLRSLLDQAAVVLHRAHTAAFGLADAYERDRTAVDPDRQTMLTTELRALDALEPRLEVRLGHSSRIARAFADATAAAIEVAQAVRSDPDPATATAAVDKLGVAMDSFTLATVELAGARVAPAAGTDQGTSPSSSA